MFTKKKFNLYCISFDWFFFDVFRYSYINILVNKSCHRKLIPLNREKMF